MTTSGEQPLPVYTLESQPVAETLKQRFAEFIDERTALGVERYGLPLHTHNGRDAALDMFQELLDFAQYQEQDRLEAWNQVAKLSDEVAFYREKWNQVHNELRTERKWTNRNQETQG